MDGLARSKSERNEEHPYVEVLLESYLGKSETASLLGGCLWEDVKVRKDSL